MMFLQKINKLLPQFAAVSISLVMMCGLLLVLTPQSALAAGTCPDGKTQIPDNLSQEDRTAFCADHQKPETTGSSGPVVCPTEGCVGDQVARNRIVTEVINPLIKIFSVMIGVVAVIMLIIAGIIYSAAQDDPKQISLAKKIIMNVIIGLVAYLLLIGFLNFILPQGLPKP